MVAGHTSDSTTSINLRQLTSGDEAHRMLSTFAGSKMNRTGSRSRRFNVLNKRSAQNDVEELFATADAQNRLGASGSVPRGERHFHEGDIQCLTIRIDWL